MFANAAIVAFGTSWVNEAISTYLLCCLVSKVLAVNSIYIVGNTLYNHHTFYQFDKNFVPSLYLGLYL